MKSATPGKAFSQPCSFAQFAWIVAWRPKEIRSLTWLDVDGDTIRLHAENAKIRVARSVPLVGELAELIARRRLVRAGVSQSVIMSIGGWKTDAMFRRYNITSDADQRAALTAREA